MYSKKLISYVAAGKILLSVSLVFANSSVTMPIGTSHSGALSEWLSSKTSISANGRYVAFQSAASDLVDGDSNDTQDIFIRDTLNDTTQRVSVHSSGVQANGPSGSPAISADGRFVAFASHATNLADENFGHSTDVFIHDRLSGKTTRVSQVGKESHALGSFTPSISADGRYIAYASELPNLVSNDRNNMTDIFVYDRIKGTTSRITPKASASSYLPSISADGTFVSFYSYAANLVSPNTNLVSPDNNYVADVFVHNRVLQKTYQVSVNVSGEQGDNVSFFSSISANGRYITYTSDATNLVSGDTNADPDVFVYDTHTRTTRRVSINNYGEQGNARSGFSVISADGRYIAYASYATNLVDDNSSDLIGIFVYDQRDDNTLRVNLGELGGNSNAVGYPSISADGRRISISTGVNRLLENDDDIFVQTLFDSLELTDEYKTSFETGAWSEGWYSYGWNLDGGISSEGHYSLRTQAGINDGVAAVEWYIDVANEGQLSFDMKLESEKSYDFFRFYINDVLQAEYSGTIDWAQYHYTLPEGKLRLKFEYVKDTNRKDGEDVAWIDNIHFVSNIRAQLRSSFVERFYVNILGRPSDSSGLAFWINSLQSTSAMHVAYGFFNSSEFRSLGLNNHDFVSILYHTVFGRDADPAGLTYWLAKLENGFSRYHVLYSFFQSTEFRTVAEQSGVTSFSKNDHTGFLVYSFVRRFYVNVLGRAPEPEGINGWSASLLNGTISASDIAIGFFLSDEFIAKKHGDNTFVDLAYKTILGRSADEGGKKTWMKALANGMTRSDIILSFIDSKEFKALAASYSVKVRLETNISNPVYK